MSGFLTPFPMLLKSSAKILLKKDFLNLPVTVSAEALSKTITYLP
jgi:hypothetical protein